MKTLIVCYSLTGKTRAIAQSMADTIGADYVEMKEIFPYTMPSAYTRGVLKARKRQNEDILPVRADVSEYDCVVVAGPVWASSPAPALYDFVREYDLEGKQTFGLLTCRREAGAAAKILREELETAQSLCRSVITVKADKETVRAFVSRKLRFALGEDGRVTLEKEGVSADAADPFHERKLDENDQCAGDRAWK